MVITKPRQRGRGGGRGGRNFRTRGRRNNRRREPRHQRTAAEQLDYDMELMRAQREGREEEFKEEERTKLRERAAARLDAEMDDYFNSRPEKDDKNAKPQDDASNGSKKEDLAEGNGNIEPSASTTADAKMVSDTPKKAVATENGNDSGKAKNDTSAEK